MTNKEQVKKKQQYVILGGLAFLGILLLMLGNEGETTKAKEQNANIPTESVYVQSEATGCVTELEQKLAYTLSKIQGAGEVTVQIKVKSSGKKEYATDTQYTSHTTTESNGTDTQQMTEIQEQRTIVQQNQNGAQEALLLETYEPEISGVLVVATGAVDALVEEQLLHAVATVLQLPLHQIMVVPGKE